MDQQAFHEIEIMEASLSNDSEEVTEFIARYMAKSVLKKSECNECRARIIQPTSNNSSSILALVSRGGLIQLSDPLSSISSAIFA